MRGPSSAAIGRAAVSVLVALGPLAGCGQPPMLDELSPDSTCRRTMLVGSTVEADSARRERLTVRWRLPEEVDEVRQLNAWCAAVGPAAVGGWAPPADSAPVDSIALVAWNVHVGGGALRRLVEDLRSGALTGQGAVDHFVLLLQEAHRGGATVPSFDASLPGGSGVYDPPPGGVRQDIVRDAEALGLDLFYAPSMRNGRTEDRGNAILSTLPLEELTAIPLPVARQRRVAIAAELSGARSDGEPWRLQVASVHLESDAAGLANDAVARMRQARALLETLPEHRLAVAAGDFNTRRGALETELVNTMRRAYPDTPPFPPGPTYRRAWGLYRLYLDYMFFRLPDGAHARYDRVADPYGSDHYPLVGWVRLGSDR